MEAAASVVQNHVILSVLLDMLPVDWHVVAMSLVSKTCRICVLNWLNNVDWFEWHRTRNYLYSRYSLHEGDTEASSYQETCARKRNITEVLRSDIFALEYPMIRGYGDMRLKRLTYRVVPMDEDAENKRKPK